MMIGLIRPILNRFRRLAGAETPEEEVRRLKGEWDRLQAAVRRLRASGWDEAADDDAVRAAVISREILALQGRIRLKAVRGPERGEGRVE